MSNLSDKEIRFLNIIEGDEVSRRYSLQKLKGLKWYKPLEERDFLDPNNNPQPVKNDDDTYRIPTWDILYYLLNTLESEEKIEEPYITKYLTFIKEVTKDTQPEDSNYRTWWMFAQMLPHLADHLDSKFIEKCIPVWLSDRFTTSIIVDELGNELLPKLIKLDKKEAALSLLKSLVGVKKKDDGIGLESFEFKADNYWVSKFLDEQLSTISNLGKDALNIFEEKLVNILHRKDQKEDFASIIWRPAIEEHDQNSDYSNKAANTLVTTIRDLLAQIDDQSLLSEDHLQVYLNSNLNVLRRIAINHINKTWPRYKAHVSNLAHSDYFKSYCKHELYKLLEFHFDDFDDQWQEQILNIIEGFNDYSDEEYKKEQIAYQKLSWLKAIKESSNDKARQRYKKNLDITGREPSHPSFPFYMESGFVSNKSPYSVSELASLGTEELISTLNNFEEEKNQFNRPTKRGLADSFKQLLNSSFNVLVKELDKFINLKDLYLCEVIRYFRNNIDEDDKINISKALNFCDQVVQERIDLYGVSHSKTLEEVNRFLTEITRSDEIVTNDREFEIIEGLISEQLNLIENDRSKILDNKSYLTKAINTHKGKVLETLINYALLRCRLADKQNNRHSEIWNELKKFFNNELKEDRINYVTTAIFTRYLPNLLYLSDSWVEQHLPRLFPLENERDLWLASIDGYGYSKYLNMVFNYLVNNNQLEEVFKAYDEEEIEFRIFQKYVQSIAIHFLLNDGSEALDVLFSRRNDEEISELVSYVWSTRDNLHSDHIPYVFKLWKKLYEYIQGNETEFKKTLSYLSNWSVYVNDIDEEKHQLLEQAAPYAFYSHHLGIFLEELNRLADNYPEETADLFLKSLENEVVYLDKSGIKKFLKEIFEAGYIDRAEKISNRFFEAGHSDITDFLIELKKEQ